MAAGSFAPLRMTLGRETRIFVALAAELDALATLR